MIRLAKITEDNFDKCIKLQISRFYRNGYYR